MERFPFTKGGKNTLHRRFLMEREEWYVNSTGYLKYIKKEICLLTKAQDSIKKMLETRAPTQSRVSS